MRGLRNCMGMIICVGVLGVSQVVGMSASAREETAVAVYVVEATEGSESSMDRAIPKGMAASLGKVGKYNRFRLLKSARGSVSVSQGWEVFLAGDFYLELTLSGTSPDEKDYVSLRATFYRRGASRRKTRDTIAFRVRPGSFYVQYIETEESVLCIGITPK